MKRDEVYRDPKGQIVDFVFDETVAAAFPDMIRRSVPGYEVVVPLTGLLTARAVAAAASDRVYDLGCSLGATTLAILRQLEPGTGHIVAVDNSAAMLAEAASHIADPRVELREADVTDLELEPCAAVTMNWLQQFLPPADRLAVLERIREALDPKGVLLVSEKIVFEDPAEQALMEAAHLDFKRANGYSELEISQKRTALENVMIIDSEAAHRERFARAGFSEVTTWFRCLNWASFLVRP